MLKGGDWNYFQNVVLDKKKKIIDFYNSEHISKHFFSSEIDKESTVKPAHVVTSIKQSPALKGHIFLVLS